MKRTHFGQHDNCYGCHLQTLQFAGGKAELTDKADRKLSKDLAAYNRLRMSGLQPKTVRDCAELETRSHTQWEIDHHHLVAPDVWRQHGSLIEDVQNGIQEARNMQVTPQDIKKWRDDAKTA